MKFVTSNYIVDPTTPAKLGFQGWNGSVPHNGEIYTFGVYFFLSIYVSIFLYFFMSLLTCTGRAVDRMNIVNGSSDVFPCNVGTFGVKLF